MICSARIVRCVRNFLRSEKMSFSNDVRNELCSVINDKDKKFACLYGMLLFSKTLSPEKICFQTESSVSAERFARLFRSVFKYEPECTERERRSGCLLRCYEISDRIVIDEVYKRYHLSAGARTIDYDIVSTGSLGVFTAGVFLAGGSVNDPAKEYHLEFVSPEEELAKELLALLAEIDIRAGITVRRSQYVVYIKESESIEDVLTFMGAQQCTLDLINVKIYKDMRNKVNRIANCDNANIDKVVAAASRQADDIELIARTIGLDQLPEELKEVAELRLENSDMSLKDIGESLSEPISRSGVNHRFRKLARIAEEIRKGGRKIEK